MNYCAIFHEIINKKKRNVDTDEKGNTTQIKESWLQAKIHQIRKILDGSADVLNPDEEFFERKEGEIFVL